MSKNKNDDQLIERFLDFDLSEQELNAFEMRMDNDEVFKNQVANFESANYVTELIVTDETMPQDLINSLGKENPNNYKKVLLFLFILGLISLCVYLSIPSQKGANHHLLYAEVEEYTTLLSTDVSRGDNISMDAQTSSIQSTIQKLTILNQEKNTSDKILEVEQLLSNEKNTDAQEIISWWLVKFHLDNHHIDKAKSVLNDIANNASFNSSYKANELLKTI